MKRFLIFLLFVCSNAVGGITDLKLSTAQIFDVQWYISGGRLYASGFSYIYASVNYATQTTSAARWTLAQTQDASANGRYIGFFNSTTNPGTYGMAVFNSDGSRYKIINNTGSFAALADGAIFYNGNGMWGTLITTGQGYNNGQSGNWAVTQSNPTNTQLQAYTPPSSEPLAAGQTAAPAGPPPPPALCCGGSASPFNASATNVAKIQSFVNRTTNDSRVNIEQLGTQNEVVVNQSGTKQNYVNYYGNGLSNDIDIKQTGNGSTQVNYTDLRVVGNFNTVKIEQTSTGGGKGAFVNVQDNNSSLILKQQGSGSHYAEINLSGGNKTVDVLQEGTAGHMASVTLTGPQPSSLNLIQSGTTQQYYSITNNCTTAGGCAPITVTQGR
jgi:hypothetical protein